MSLPIIPLLPLLPSSPSPSARLETAQRLHEACITHGFFYLDLTGFSSQEETEELRELAREFFELPREEKERIWLGRGDWARGYQKLNENVTRGKPDAHEAIDFYAPSPFPPSPPLTPISGSGSGSESGEGKGEGRGKGVRPLSGENQWPPDPRFRERFERWVGRMKVLGLVVMEAMALGLGLTEPEWLDLRRKVENSFWVLRVIGYPPLPEGHDGFSCGAHKDYGCLTFLWADKTEGALQVFVPDRSSSSSASSTHEKAGPGVGEAREGENTTLGPAVEGGVTGTWIPADPVEGCVVCNIGEMWEVWTRGLYRSTLHRVLYTGSNYRISIPFFYEPAFDALVEPLPGVDRLLAQIRSSEDRTSEAYARAVLGVRTEYKPVVYGEFLMNKVGGNFDKGDGKGGRY